MHATDIVGYVHLHARYARSRNETGCRTVCGRPCDDVTVAFRRDGAPSVATCPACIAGLPGDKPGFPGDN